MNERFTRLGRLAVLAGNLTLALPAAAPAQSDLDRGKYLMSSIVACGNCHTPKFGPLKDVEFAGGFPIKTPAFDAVTPNITPDPNTGVGKWTDAQLATAIRDCKRPDGSLIGPPMACELYRNISDRDVRALVAYMKQVKPVANKVEKSKYHMPLPPAYGPPVTSVPEVSPADKVAYGRYLAGPLGHCIECHTPMGAQPGRRDYAGKLGAGGEPFEGPWGVVLGANITPDRETGIGNWTDDQIKAAITKGVRPDGTALKGPMAFPFYANIAAADLDALVAYLRTLKPVSNRVR
jgi:mono/diheme cytochrome c family protein